MRGQVGAVFILYRVLCNWLVIESVTTKGRSETEEQLVEPVPDIV
jgi:hypothetical protein